MKVRIIDEENDWIGVRVVDNNTIEHKIAVEFDGKTRGHSQNGYPDNSNKRSLEENEHVAQARRLAKYYVYRKYGYDTLPPSPNPDRIAATAVFVDALSTDAFERYFSDYYQQMLSEQGRAEPVVDVPAQARTNPLYFRKDIYLSLSHEELQSFISDSDRSAFDALQIVADTANADQTPLYALIEELKDEQIDSDTDDEQRLAELFLEAVSGVHVMWSPANNQTETVETDVPEIDRKPDARFELPPYDPDSLDEFRDTLVYHLKCQMRDCYLTMGVAPPENLRIQGPGWFDRSTWFQHYDVYEPYHRTDIDITDWQEQYTPDDISS